MNNHRWEHPQTDLHKQRYDNHLSWRDIIFLLSISSILVERIKVLILFVNIDNYFFNEYEIYRSEMRQK